MTPTEQDSPTASRRPLAVAAAVLVALGLIAALALWSDADGTTPTTTAAPATTGPQRPETPADASTPSPTPSAEPGAGPGSGAEDGPPTGDLPVDIQAVAGGTEVELCAAIVERLGQYRAAAEAGRVDQALIDLLAEFEAQVDTQSDDRSWGDAIIEQLTNVRREWVTALAATEEGDPAAADHFRAALGHLDAARDSSVCPT